MMYATLVSSKISKLDWQRTSITRGPLVILAVLVVLTCTNLRTQIRFNSEDLLKWREAPEYVGLFAPPRQRSAYRAWVSPLGIQATLQQIVRDPGVLNPPGAWAIQAQIPYDAFGLSGSYNRWKVAGLYRSRRALVAHGPRLDQGQMESWTLITPYPDASLERLEPGTLILALRIPSD
jgi:hypothetical protein